MSGKNVRTVEVRNLRGRFFIFVFPSVFFFFLVAVALVAAQNGDPTKGKEQYDRACVPCHGMSGKGDGPIAISLGVRPRDHTDDKVMSILTDQEILQVIKGGGASVKKSPQMPSFSTPANHIGIALSDEEIRDVVSYIRTLHRPSKSPKE